MLILILNLFISYINMIAKNGAKNLSVKWAYFLPLKFHLRALPRLIFSEGKGYISEIEHTCRVYMTI